MADLNALIAQGYQPPAPIDPFAQYAKMQQLNVGQNQNALAQYQLAQAQRQDVQANALNAAYASATNPETGEVDYKKITSALASGGAGSQIPAVLKNQLEYKNAQTERDIKSTELLSKKLAMLPEAYLRADTPEAYLQLHQSVHADPVIGPYLKSVGATPEKGLATLQNAIQTGTFDDLRLKSMQGVSQILDSMKPITGAAGGFVYDPKTKSFMQAPEKTPAPTELVRNYEYAKSQGFVGSIFDYEKKLKEAGRPPAAPRPESAPVAVVDPVTGKQVLVSREEAISKRLSPAAAMESLPPKEIQKREAALPQATSAVQGFESKSDKFIADLKALRDDPGLENITGAIYGRTPSVTREGSRAQALYDKVVAKGGFQALQDLRDASKTGGALGNISNQEGKQLTASFAAIDRRQNAEDVRAAIDQAISDIEGTRTRMREAYDSTYSYKNGGAPAPAAGKPPAPAGGTLSAAEQAELAALRKRFGK